MKHPGDEQTPPGGHADRRRRLFEASRGLFGRRALPVDEEGTVVKPDVTETTREQPCEENEPDADRDER